MGMGPKSAAIYNPGLLKGELIMNEYDEMVKTFCELADKVYSVRIRMDKIMIVCDWYHIQSTNLSVPISHVHKHVIDCEYDLMHLDYCIQWSKWDEARECADRIDKIISALI